MGVYEELVARGLIAQVTDEEEIRELVNSGKATFYIGFEPCRSLYGSLPYEKTSDGRQQANCTRRRRHRYDR